VSEESYERSIAETLVGKISKKVYVFNGVIADPLTIDEFVDDSIPLSAPLPSCALGLPDSDQQPSDDALR
jgi:hypothetical protein